MCTSSHERGFGIASIDLEIKPTLDSETELLAKLSVCKERVLHERLRRRLNIRRGIGNGTTHRNTHHLWRLEDVVFVSIPNEAYSALQIALRKEASPLSLFVATLTNSTHDYLTPAEFYKHDHYASWQSCYESGCFETTLETLRKEIADLMKQNGGAGCFSG